MGVAGRPKGSTTRPQLRNFVTEEQIQEFVEYMVENYQKKPELAKWFGDQLFGKAVQPIGNDDRGALIVQFDNAFASSPKTNS